MAERFRGVLAAALVVLAAAAPARLDARAEPASGTAPATTLLLLPSLRSPEGREISPWSGGRGGGEAPRFERFETALASRLRDAGYGVVTTEDALARAGVREALANAAPPLTPEAAAEAARAAGAQVALVVRAEAIRTGGGAASGLETTDALVDADAYRASDGVRLASATKRVTGSGADAMEADAEALARVAAPLFEALQDPLAKGVARAVVEPRPMPIVLEGQLDWRTYTETIIIMFDALPEMTGLEERRFEHGRFMLRATCGCEPAEAARRLDGLTREGLRLSAAAEGDVLRVTVAWAEPAPGAPPPVTFGEEGEPAPGTPP